MRTSTGLASVGIGIGIGAGLGSIPRATMERRVGAPGLPNWLGNGC